MAKVETYPTSITVRISQNNQDYNFSYSPGDHVATSGNVTLISDVPNTTLNVCTYQNGTLTTVFSPSTTSPPYSAPTGSGTQYTLLSNISGQITLTVSTSGTCSSSPSVDADGSVIVSNGIINVGG